MKQRLNPIPRQVAKGLCRGCQQPVPKGRRSWCGQECIDDQIVRSGNSSWVGALVFARDHGVCALCGSDALMANRILRRLTASRYRQPYDHDSEEAASLILLQWGIASRFAALHLWEADHIVPVAEGGGGCGLDGYRTLCRACHAKETGALRRRLSARRRAERQPDQPTAAAQP